MDSPDVRALSARFLTLEIPEVTQANDLIAEHAKLAGWLNSIQRSSFRSIGIEEALYERRAREARLNQVRLALGIFDYTGKLGQ